MDLANTMGIGVIVSMAVTNMTALSTAQRSLSSLFITAEGGTAKLTGLGKAMVGVAAAAASMKAGMAALNFTMGNIEAYADYETSMAHVQGLTQLSAEGMAQLEAQATQMARTSRYTRGEIMDTYWELFSAGYELNEVLDLTQPVLEAAVSGQMELAESADLTTSALRSFGIPAEETRHALDQMQTAIRVTKIHWDEYAAGFGRFGGVMSAINQDLATSITLFGIIRSRGISGTRAATMSKMMGTHLLNVSEEERREWNELGVYFFDESGAFRSMIDIVGDIAEARPSLVEGGKDLMRELGIEDVEDVRQYSSERLRSFIELYGMRAVVGLFNILGAQQQVNGVMYEGVDVWRALYEEVKGNEGALSSYYDTVLGTINEQKAIIETTINLIRSQIGEALAEDLEPILEKINKGLEQVSEFLETHPEVAKAIGYTVLIAGVLFMAVGVFALLALLIGGIAAAVGSVGAGIVFGIPALLFAVLAAIPAIAYLVYTHFEEIKTFLMPYFQVIKQVVIRLIERLKVIWEVLWPAIKALLPVLYLGLMAALNILSIIVGFLLIGLDTIFASVETIYWLLYGLFTWDWEKVSSEIAAIWEGVSADIDEIMEVFIEKAYEAFVKIGDNILRWIMGEQAYTHAAEMNRISQEVMDAASEGNLAGVGGGIGSAVDVGMWGPGGWDARLAELAVPPQASGNRSVPRSGLYYLEEEEGVTQRGETSKQNIFNFRDIIVQLMGSGNNEQDAREIADLVYAEIENRLARVQ
jgi:hypothetical protein